MKLGTSGLLLRSVIGLRIQSKLVCVKQPDAVAMVVTVVTIQTKWQSLATLAAAAPHQEVFFFILTRRVN